MSNLSKMTCLDNFLLWFVLATEMYTYTEIISKTRWTQVKNYKLFIHFLSLEHPENETTFKVSEIELAFFPKEKKGLNLYVYKKSEKKSFNTSSKSAGKTPLNG